jgi:hypothetical protein
VKRINFSLRIEHLWALIVLVGIFVFVNTHPIRPYDFWWHITVGREIMTSGQIPTTDVYSYTAAGQPYPSYQMFWLMDIILYEVYKLGGPALIVFLQSLMVTSAYTILFIISLRVTKNWRIAAMGTLFAAALGLNDWNVRPQSITFLLASLILLAIYGYQRKPQWGWLAVFPACLLVWANSHGTFVIGLVLIAIWWGQELWTALLEHIRNKSPIISKTILIPGVVFVTSCLACLINPRGLGIISYVRTLTSNSAVQNLVTEWAPPSFTTLMGAIFFVGLIISGILLVVSPRRPSFYQVVAYLGFAILSLRTSRGIVWFGLVMAPIVAERLTVLVNHYKKAVVQSRDQGGSRIINTVFIAVILLMGLITLPWFKSTLPLPTAKAGLISAETPLQATEVLLDQSPPRRLFNAMSFGSYLIWAAYPEYRVFADSRIELFPEKIWLDYFSISNADGNWEERLADYGVNTLMLSQTEQQPLIKAVVSSDNWDLIYSDQVATVYTRRKQVSAVDIH